MTEVNQVLAGGVVWEANNPQDIAAANELRYLLKEAAKSIDYLEKAGWSVHVRLNDTDSDGKHIATATIEKTKSL